MNEEVMSNKEFFWEVIGSLIFIAVPIVFVYCLYNPHMLPSF